MPRAGSNSWPACRKKQAAVTTGSAENNRHSPRDGFPVSSALSPGNRLSCPRHSDARQSTSNLASAPGCQDHTASPSAIASFVGKRSARCDTIHVHRICGPTLVTIARRPSWKAETRRNVRVICPDVASA